LLFEYFNIIYILNIKLIQFIILINIFNNE